ncbi:MAG: hypothetical protein GY850_38455 [bacterium]|nr:hypothetical protein [bacterium]
MRSWEISFTNEFLTQMERFRGILICTTNRVKDLDAASLRRLNHKIGFDYLTSEGNTIFYEKFLGPRASGVLDQDLQKILQTIQNLTPVDLKVVRDRFSFYPAKEIHHDLLIESLEEEARLKPEAAAKKQIGFCKM